MSVENTVYVQNNCAEYEKYQLNRIQKEEIMKRLRKMGCRITKQRQLLIDIILEKECSCCKEIYYIASKQMPEIGIATIYRMLNSLEEVGAIQRRNIYMTCGVKECEVEQCIIEFESGTKAELSKEALQLILENGMRVCGYKEYAKITRVMKINLCK